MLRICIAILCFFSVNVSATNCYDWMDKQIEEDFRYVEKFKLSKVFEEHKKINNPQLALYYIKNGQLFGPNNTTYRFLEEVLKRYKIPDLAFIYPCFDILRRERIDFYDLQVPVLSSAKAPNSEGKIIHFIDWYFDPKNQNSGLLGMLKEINQNFVPWPLKKNILFWRGGTTDKGGQGSYHNSLDQFPRGVLVKKSTEYPEYIDAKFNWLANPMIQSHFPTAPHESIAEHIKYKYQITMDGETATYPGFQWRLFSNSLCIKQDSDETMWFYGALTPWIHYVPVKRDLSDLEEVITYLINNDLQALRIATNARIFAQKNLQPEHMYLYAYKVLMKYASKIEQ